VVKDDFMPTVRTFERISMEEAALKVGRRTGDRLFNRPPGGMRVVEALGSQAVVGANYPPNRLLKHIYVVTRHPHGLRVATHQFIPKSPYFDCKMDECVAVDMLSGGITEIEHSGDDEIDTVARLRRQQEAYGTLDLLLRTGGDDNHNPFEGRVAGFDLMTIADHHQDPMLAELADFALRS
jgi:hypothetical protein